MVGAKVKTCPLPCPHRKRLEERGLEQAVLVVPALGPGIGKQHENRTESRIRRQRREEIERLGVKKMQVGPPGAVPLAAGPGNALGAHVKAKAKLIRMGRGIGGEKMPVAAADFAHKTRHGRQHARERSTQIGAALGDKGKMRRTGSGGFHGGNSQRKDAKLGRTRARVGKFSAGATKLGHAFSKSPPGTARTPWKRVSPALWTTEKALRQAHAWAG